MQIPTTTHTNTYDSSHLPSYSTPNIELHIGDYQIKRTIGEGSFSKVKLAIHNQTNQLFAIKILDKQKLPVNDLKRFTREMQILISLNHPNIIQVTEILENKSFYYIVMEYCSEGDLFNYIIHKNRLSEEETSFLFYQIINGIDYIHSQNISHRDLKPENILMLPNRIVKIIDFGLSNYYKEKDTLMTPCGSPCYASPEMIIGKGYDGYCVDIWSTGVIVYAMICGYLPFEDKSNQKLFRKILKDKQKYPSFVSRNVRDILDKMLCKEPKDRISIKNIKKHPFYLEGKNIYNIKFNPAYDFVDDVDYCGGSYFQSTVPTEQNQDKRNKMKNHTRNNNKNKICEDNKQKPKQNQIYTRNNENILDNSHSLISSDYSNVNIQSEENIQTKKVNYNTNSITINTDNVLDSIDNDNTHNKNLLSNKLQSNHNNNHLISQEKTNKFQTQQIPSPKKKPVTKLTTYNVNTTSSITNSHKNTSHLIKVNKRLLLTSSKKQLQLQTQMNNTRLLTEPNKMNFTPIKNKANFNMNLTTYNYFKQRISLSNRISSSLDKKFKGAQMFTYKGSQTAHNSKSKIKRKDVYITESSIKKERSKEKNGFIKIECLLNKNRSKSKSVPKNNISFMNKKKIKNKGINNDEGKIYKGDKFNIYHPITTMPLNSTKKSEMKMSLKLHSGNVSSKNNVNYKEGFSHRKNNTLVDMACISNKINDRLLHNEKNICKLNKSNTNKLNNTFSNRCIKNKH